MLAHMSNRARLRRRDRLQRVVLGGRFPRSATGGGTVPPSSWGQTTTKGVCAGGGGGDPRQPLSSQTSICVAPPSSCVLLLLHPSTSVLHLLLLRLVPYLLLRNILQLRKKKRWRLRALKLLARREMQTAHAFRRFSHEGEGVNWGAVVDLHRSTVTDD